LIQLLLIALFPLLCTSAVQRLTAGLQELAGFAGGTCATAGPVYTLINSHSLAQQLANVSINLCSALGSLVSALAGLGASQELQEDLAQLGKQLGRGLHCSYSEAQHRLLLELYVQVRGQQGQLPSITCCCYTCHCGGVAAATRADGSVQQAALCLK
jgi:hypothetical protein